MGIFDWTKKIKGAIDAPVANSFKGSAGVGEALGKGAGKVAAGATSIPIAAGGMIGNAAKTSARAGAHVAAGGAGVARGFFKTGFGKVTGIGALATAALVTGAVLIGRSRGKAHKAEREQAMAEAMAAPTLAPTEQMSGPMDGMAADKWRETVTTSRNPGTPAR